MYPKTSSHQRIGLLAGVQIVFRANVSQREVKRTEICTRRPEVLGVGAAAARTVVPVAIAAELVVVDDPRSELEVGVGVGVGVRIILQNDLCSLGDICAAGGGGRV
jgi:hypothetical protein